MGFSIRFFFIVRFGPFFKLSIRYVFFVHRMICLDIGHTFFVCQCLSIQKETTTKMDVSSKNSD